MGAIDKPEVNDCAGRNLLHEGRNCGAALSFCKRDGNKFTAVHPLAGCKDYLSDVVYTEATGKPVLMYGLQTKVNKIFEDGVGYLAMSIIKHPQFHNAEDDPYYPTLAKDIEKFMASVESMQKVMRFLDEAMKLESMTMVYKSTKDNMLLVVCPRFWTEAPYRISLYSLILRNAMRYKDGEVYDFITKQTGWDSSDAMTMKSAVPKFNLMIKGVYPPPKYPDVIWMSGTPGSEDMHNCGITYVKFPEAK